MDTILLLTILVVVFALAFDFINGFHDTANAIATSVSTRALKPRTAIYDGSCHELHRSAHIYRSCKNNFQRHCRSFRSRKWLTRHLGGTYISNCLESDYMVFRNPIQFIPCLNRFNCWCSYFSSRFRYFKLRRFLKNITSASYFTIHRACGRLPCDVTYSKFC